MAIVGFLVLLLIVEVLAFWLRQVTQFLSILLIYGPCRQILILDIVIDGFHVVLANLYGPNKDDPDFYFDVFSRLDTFDSSRLIIAGDMNVALGPLDCRGSRPTHGNVDSFKALLSLMDASNLINIWRTEHPNVRAYTKHQKIPPVLSRLDYILVSSNLANNVSDSEIICGIKSDHSIVTCKISNNNPSKGKGFWKLNYHFLVGMMQTLFLLLKTRSLNLRKFTVTLLVTLMLFGMLLSVPLYITGHCIQYCSQKKK